MSANSDFLKQLREIQGKSPIQLKALPTAREFVATAQGVSISGRFMLVFAAIFAILVALILIHFFVTPILPESLVNTTVIPGMNDETLKWSRTGIDAQDIPTPPIQNDENPIVTTATQITVMFDLIIDAPVNRVGKHRVFLYRTSGTASETALDGTVTANSLLRIIPSYNFIVFMDPQTNDLLLGTMLLGPNNTLVPSQFTRIYNLPVRKSHRITMVILDNYMEVYFNGKLFKTSKFNMPIAQVTGQIYGPTTEMKKKFGRLANLRLWKRPLTANEISNYGSGSEFQKVNIV